MRTPGISMRTCVGCRARAEKSDLLRVVAVEAGQGSERLLRLVPDPPGRRPGRGAYLHRDPGCLDHAERRRAFSRALRRAGPLDVSELRLWFEERVTGQEEGETT